MTAPTPKAMPMPGTTKSFDLMYERYCNLLEDFNSANGIEKKMVLFRKLVNILIVLEFLANLQ